MAVKAQSYMQLFDRDKAASAFRMRYDHQRNISPLHLDAVKTMMVEGTFSPVNTIMFADVGGKHNALINGQHTMLAIDEIGTAYELPVVQYHCDTEDERAQLYYRADKPRRRNLGDSTRSLHLPSSLNLTPTQISLTVAAFRHIKGNWGTNRHVYGLMSDDKAISLIPFWRDDVASVYEAITPCNNEERRTIIRKAVLSVALITMHYSRDKAFGFWRQVAQDDGLERYDPRKTIRTWLHEKASSGGDRRTRILDNEVSRGVALAWNAHCENRTLRYINVKDVQKPIVLDGTPYRGYQDKDFLPEWSNFAFSQAIDSSVMA